MSDLPQTTRATHVSASGDVTIPKLIRDYLGLAEGDPVEFVVTDEGVVLVRPQFKSARPLKGLLKRYAGNKPASLEEIENGIGHEVAVQLVASGRNE